MHRVRIETVEGDAATGHLQPRLTVVKQLSDDSLFSYQVRWLVENRGPGIAELDRVSRAECAYSTRFGGSHTLRTWGLAPESTRPVLQALVEILGPLHRRGRGHGALVADHIVLGRQGLALISPSPSEMDSSIVEADIGGLARLITERAELWAALGVVEKPLVDQWRSVAAAVAECRIGQHTKVAGRISELALRPRRSKRWR